MCVGMAIAYRKMEGERRIFVENEIMQIIVYAGNARSLAMQSIQAAKKGQQQAAAQAMKEADTHLKEAHHTHAHILSTAADENKSVELTLFMVHGEDHLMSAVTTIDLAKEILGVHDELKEIRAEVQQIKKGEGK